MNKGPDGAPSIAVKKKEESLSCFPNSEFPHMIQIQPRTYHPYPQGDVLHTYYVRKDFKIYIYIYLYYTHFWGILWTD